MHDPFLRASLAALAFAVLGGCTSLSGLGGSSEFQCQAPEGVPCMSVSGISANDLAGTLPKRSSGAAALARGAPGVADVPRPRGAPGLQPILLGAAQPQAGRLGAIRSDPTVIRVWIAPWEDADGDLHDQAYVYLQIDSGRWLIEHNRERIRRDFSPRAPQVAAHPTPVAAPAAASAPAMVLLPPRADASAQVTPSTGPRP